MARMEGTRKGLLVLHSRIQEVTKLVYAKMKGTLQWLMGVMFWHRMEDRMKLVGYMIRVFVSWDGRQDDMGV